MRVYLSLLSTLRFVSYAKKLFGDLSMLNFSGNRNRLCHLEGADFINSVKEIRKSLTYFEEGMTIGPTDPKTSHRKSREKIQAKLAEVLAAPIWSKFESYTDFSTPEGKVGKEMIAQYCDS